jgi:hypothetical protein
MNVREILGARLTEDTTIEDLIEMLEADNSTVSVREYNAMKDKSDKNAKEAASYRKQLNANKSQEEINKEETQRQMDELASQNADLTKKLSIMENEKKFISMGYNEESAHKVASALAEGDMKSFFKQQEIFNAELNKKYKAEALNNTKTPGQDDNHDDIMTKEKLSTMSLREQMKFAEENPSEYQSIYGKGE